MKKAEKNIIIENDPRVMTISLGGEIDHHSAKEYHRHIDSAVIEKRPQVVFLDLSGVSFMDSSGLGLILGRYRLFNDLGIKLKIVSPNRNVMKILKLAGCEKIIEIVGKKDA